MLVRILVDGESPDIGMLIKGAERIICPEALAILLVKRGLAEEIKTNLSPLTLPGSRKGEEKKSTAQSKTEVKDNG